MKNLPVVLTAVLAACTAAPAAAQGADPNPGRLTLTAGVDVANAYMFRGIRQDDTGVITWPWADAAIDVFDGSGGLQNVVINVGTWNSLHSGETGSDGPNEKLWYESDFYTGVTLGLPRTVSVGALFTAYTSPNNMFSSVKELAIRVGMDETAAFTNVSLRPYVLAAFEMATSPGQGQADGGLEAGRYLEIGIAPGWTNERATIAFPVKTGWSLSNYYELAGEDHAFGFLSAAAAASVPLGSATGYGAWTLRGTIEFQALGDTPEAFNGGDQSKIVGSVGITLTY